MKLHKIAFADTHSFASLFLDYIDQKPQLQSFYSQFPKPENFKKQIEEKNKSYNHQNREVLVKALEQQYNALTASEKVQRNITSLKEKNTFTIVTGHQLNLFTGPLYFIYKIVTVINTCKILKQQYPDYNFVPVYWAATEDHDFEEIKSFKLYGKKYSWETDQKGAVGRFKTKGIENLIKELPGDINIFKTAYLKHNNLREAVRYYVNALFGDEGLIMIDGDDHDLKNPFKSVINDDLLNHSTKALVEKQNAELEKQGYKSQVFARDINFFYLDEQLRERIEKNGEVYEVLNTDIKFSAKEIETVINTHAEKFSPNVILRPLYQEMILPNLAYVGGPAEVAYWLQFKLVFDHYTTTFPVLIPRNFAMVLDGPTSRKFEKTGISIEELFIEKNILFNKTIKRSSGNKILLETEKENITKQFEVLKTKAEQIDKSLEPMVAAETRRAIKSLEKIEQKLLRAEKRLHTDKLNQIEAVKDALFPHNSLQERVDNFLNFYQQDPAFIQKLLQHFDPFDFRFNVIVNNY
jgi:bacillithiol synthase